MRIAGCACSINSAASVPNMPGMLMSIVQKSTCCSAVILIASSPQLASMISQSGCAADSKKCSCRFPVIVEFFHYLLQGNIRYLVAYLQSWIFVHYGRRIEFWKNLSRESGGECL